MLTIIFILIVIFLVWLFFFRDCRMVCSKELYDVCEDLCSEASEVGCTPGDNSLLKACRRSSQSEIVEAMEYCGDKSGKDFSKCALKRLESD